MEGGDQVVVLLSRPVVAGGLLPHRGGHRVPGELPKPQGGHRRLEGREEPPGVPVGVPDQELLRRRLQGHPPPVPPLVRKRPPEEDPQVVGSEGLEDEHLGPGEEGRAEGKGGVLRRRPDEEDRPLLEEGEEDVLLGPVPAVDLVEEQEVPGPGPAPLVPRGLEQRPDLGHGGQGRRAGDERRPHRAARIRPTVVFPVPGGPQKTRGSPRPSARARRGPFSPRRCRCPTTSPRSRGRSRSARGAAPCQRPSIRFHCSTLTGRPHRPYHTAGGPSPLTGR